MATLNMKPMRMDNAVLDRAGKDIIEGDVRAYKRTRPQLHFWGSNSESDKAAIVQCDEVRPQSIHITNHGESVVFISARTCRPKVEPEDYLLDKDSPSPYLVRKQIHVVTAIRTKQE